MIRRLFLSVLLVFTFSEQINASANQTFERVKIDVGNFTISLPDENGSVAILCHNSALDEGLFIEITNLTTEEPVLTSIDSDGNCSASMPGDFGDSYRFVIQDANGNQIGEVSFLSTARFSTVSSISDFIVDMEEDGSYVYALAIDKIYKINIDDDSQIEVFNLSGVSSPQGFGLDGDENIFVADSGNNRIVKLLKSTGYSPDTTISSDGSFGSFGTDDGKFDAPTDVSVIGSGDNQRIFVLDTGNNRIQEFDSIGSYSNQFDGASTPSGAISNPKNMLSGPTVWVSDSGNGIVRGISLGADNAVREAFSVPFSGDLGKFTLGSPGLVLSDTKNNQIIFFFRDGTVTQTLSVDNHPIVAIAVKSNTTIYTASSSVGGLTKVTKDRDPPGLQPKDLANQFIQAFIANDRETMLALTGNSPRSIDVLESVRANVLLAFANITSIEQREGEAFASATANYDIDGYVGSVRFEFMRAPPPYDKWIINSVF